MQSQSTAQQPERLDFVSKVLWCLVGYCVISCLTVPFLNDLWWGELPIAGVIQLPKVVIADWLRDHIVMGAITFLGFSSGSVSPDRALAAPYALGIAYLLPMLIVGVVGLYRVRSIYYGRGLAAVT